MPDPEKHLHIDIPVKLAEANMMFSIGALAFEGDMPASIFHMSLIEDDIAEWLAHSEIIAVFHTNAGHMTLHDDAYNLERNIATGNPYKELIAGLQKRGIQMELCGATARLTIGEMQTTVTCGASNQVAARRARRPMLPMPLMPMRISAAPYRYGQAAAGELIEARFERHAIERGEGECCENVDAPTQAGVKLIEQRRALDRAAREFCRIGQRPGGRNRHVAKIRAFLPSRRVRVDWGIGIRSLISLNIRRP